MPRRTDPPKVKGRKLSPAYEALIGQPRECAQCHETKPVDWKTYAPAKKSPDGVSLICRVCQGRRAHKAQLETGADLGGPQTGRKVWGFTTDPRKDFEAFEAEIDGYVEELGQLSSQTRPDVSRIAFLKKALTAATRLMGDPAGGGSMTDERLAFKAFMRVLKPILAGWSELGPIHEEIISALLSDAPSNVLLASRGSAKSTITSMFVAWLLWRDPLETVLVISRSETFARRMLRAVKSYLDGSPLLEELRPDDDQLDSAYQLEVRPAKGKLGMSVSVTCRGLYGQITGLRARRLIGDDIEGPSDDAPEAVDKIEEALAELQHIAIPNATVVLLGTPQSNFSLYGRLARNPAWKVFRAVLFESDFVDGREIFESRWPARFTPEEIEKRKRSVSKLQFALHYRLDLDETSDREQPFRLDALPVIDWPAKAPTAPIEIRGGGPKMTELPRGAAADDDDWRGVSAVSADTGPYTLVVAAVDPAGGLRGGGDAIGLAIIGITRGGRGIIRIARGVRGATTADAIKATAGIVAEHGANKLVVEEIAGGLFGMMLQANLANIGHPMSYEAVSGGGVRKARRIVEAISPALASGKLFISRDVLTSDDAFDFVSQFSGLTYDGRNLRNDDVIDALSYCVTACGSALAADDAEFVAGARHDYEQLAAMPLRRRVLTHEELEAWTEESEAEQALRLKLDRALELQQEELMRGSDAKGLARYVATLTDELAKLTNSRRKILLPPRRDPTHPRYEDYQDY